MLLLPLMPRFEAVDGPVRPVGDARDNTGPLARRLQAVCDLVAADVRRYLAQVSVAELAKGL